MSIEIDIQKAMFQHLAQFLVNTEEKCNEWVRYNEDTRFGTHIRPVVGKEGYYRYVFIIEKQIGYRYEYAHRDIIMVGEWENFRHKPVEFSKRDIFVKDGQIKGFLGDVPLNILLGIIQGWIETSISDIEFISGPRNECGLTPSVPPILL